MIIDRLGRLDSISDAVLELGAGTRRRIPGSISVDQRDLPEVDVVGDALEVLRSIPDSSVRLIHSSHFFEHVDYLQPLLAEIARVLKPEATLHVIVPHFSNPYFHSDPTHRTQFGLYTFAYLAQSSLFRRKTPEYVATPLLRLVSVRLNFRSPRPFYIRHGIKFLVQSLINASRWVQEFYEENLAYVLPCYEVEATLVRVSQPPQAT